MNLRDYPRPKNDNGIGLHFRLDLTETINKPYISQGVEWLQQINAKWTLVAGGDWLQIGKAARPIWDAGIMPVCRLVCKIDKPFIDWETGVKTLLDLGIPPYIQIFNEPGDNREWNGQPNIRRFGEKWGAAAARVFDAGGFPGMGAVLGEDEWLAAFHAVQAGGRTDIWQKAWFSVHNYGSNHPPNYPYDDVNQKGIPVTPEEYAKYRFSMPFDELNQMRAEHKHPGETILDDDTSVLRVLEFKKWMTDSLGFCLPMIGGEGGWEWQVEEDLRYPKLPDEWHANYTREMFEWFRFGKLSDSTPLPDELFSVAPWIQADGQADSWWFGPLGTKQLTIDTVAAIPSFVRKFSWDAMEQPPATPEIIVAPPTDTNSTESTPPLQVPEPVMTPPAPEPILSSEPVPSQPEPTPPPVMSKPPPPPFPRPPRPPDAEQPPEPPPPASPPMMTGILSVLDIDGEETEASSFIIVNPGEGTMTGITYIVQQGETLWGISKKFGVTLDSLLKANQLDPNAKLRAGQRLIIPR